MASPWGPFQQIPGSWRAGQLQVSYGSLCVRVCVCVCAHVRVCACAQIHAHTLLTKFLLRGPSRRGPQRCALCLSPVCSSMTGFPDWVVSGLPEPWF